MSGAVEAALAALEPVSFVAHRDAQVPLPAIRRHGDAVALEWLEAARAIFEFDREAGKAFIRGSAEAEKISEVVLPWTRQARQLIELPGASPAVEGFMQNLPRAFGSLGHPGEERWAEIGLKWCGRHADSGRAYFATPVLDLACRQGATGVEQLMTPLDELFESRKLLLATCLGGAIRVRNLLGAQAILPWALRGADLLQSGRARGEAYFRLESEESLQILLDHLPGFRMAERSRLLTLILDVWYEREFELKESGWSPEKGRPFVETDGRILYLPAVMREADEAVIAVLHAAGHIRFGSFDRAALEAIMMEAGGALPATGPVSLGSVFARFGDGSWRFQLFYDLAEDLRVDWRIQQLVPNYLRRLAGAAAAMRVPDSAGIAFYDMALASVRGALAWLAGDRSKLDPRLAPLLAAEATAADAYRVAFALYNDSDLAPVLELDAFHGGYLPGRGPNVTRPITPTESDEQNEQPQAGAEGEQQKQDEQGDDQTEAEGEQQGATEQEGERRQETAGEGKGSGARVQSSTQQRKERGGEQGQDKGIPYPEWDYREQRYKRNWAWVQERPLAEANLAEAQRLEKQYNAALKRLKKAIQAQKPTRMAPLLRQYDGDDIDINAVVGYVAERRAGMSPKANIYRRREIRQREVTVTLLADMSTSIMQHLPEGGGRLVDRVRAGVLLFAESMEEVGDPYSIAGFCSKYRDNVSYYTIKGFDEPFSEQVKSVIGGMSGRLATRMGAAIRHATASFAGTNSRRRLLLILSDGRPEDYDDGGDRRYLHEDTRMAVKEAVNQGVHPFCITVDTMANQYLPQIFGPGHYFVLDHINSLPNKLPEIYLRLRR